MTRRFQWTVVLAVVLPLISALGGRVRADDIVDTAVRAGSFKTLAAALQAADLVDALKGDGPLTVFAPTDEAFAKLPEGTVESLLKAENRKQLIDILTYHVVDGFVPASKAVKLTGAKTLNGQRIDISAKNDSVSVDEASVIQADIVCDNGIIHVVDQVLLPATDNIAATASKAGQFSTLVAAAKAAGLVEALSGDGPLTVFAPTDDAFGKLPAGTVETLLQPENRAKLASILKYHVVPGRIYSEDALAAGSARTLQGESIQIGRSGDSATVNDANLVATDLDASNGVIHVIDSVILPPERQTSAHPRQMIETAISQGAPLYNSGHAGQCAQIYMNTARQILSMSDHGMSSSVAHALQTAVTSSEGTSCTDTRAWTMRRALELAYRDLR